MAQHPDNLTRALAPILDVQPSDERLSRFVSDFLEVLPHWFPLYDLGHDFYAQGYIDFEDGYVFKCLFAPTHRVRRRKAS